MATIQPNMAIVTPGSISGPCIIDDLVSRIVDKLEKCGSLRSVDAYSGFSAEVQIKLQLRDVDTTEVASEVNVGSIDPAQPVEHIALGLNMTEVEATGAGLERTVDGSMPEGVQAQPPKRTYVSRARGQ